MCLSGSFPRLSRRSMRKDKLDLVALAAGETSRVPGAPKQEAGRSNTESALIFKLVFSCRSRSTHTPSIY